MVAARDAEDMPMPDTKTELSRRALGLGALGALATHLAPPALAIDGDYGESEIVRAAENFFGAGAEGVAAIVARVFSELGRPVGFVEGEEGSGAIGLGLRIGQGDMTLLRVQYPKKVYWRGPSIGFDTGGNASRVFTLIYGMTSPEQIFRRFPGVEGTAYFVGGVGVNYQRADGMTLAPMRTGVGFRLGANIGYLSYSPRRWGLPL
jgi:hypothetical protein